MISGPDSAGSERSARPSPESGRAAPSRRASSHERRTRHVDLGAAVVGAVAVARRAVELDHHVSELTCCPEGATVELVAEDQPAGDTGPQRDYDCLPVAATGAGPVLGQCRTVAVVVDEHGQPQPLRHHIGEGDVVQQRIHADDRLAGRPVDQHRDPEADSLYRSACGGDRLGHRPHRNVKQRLLIEPDDGSLDAVVDAERRVNGTGEQFGPAEVDADDSWRRHVVTISRRSYVGISKRPLHCTHDVRGPTRSAGSTRADAGSTAVPGVSSGARITPVRSRPAGFV